MRRERERERARGERIPHEKREKKERAKKVKEELVRNGKHYSLSLFNFSPVINRYGSYFEAGAAVTAEAVLRTPPKSPLLA